MTALACGAERPLSRETTELFLQVAAMQWRPPVYATTRACKHKPNVTQAWGNIRKMSERQENNSPIILMNRSDKQTAFMFILQSGLGGDKCQGWNVYFFIT